MMSPMKRREFLADALVGGADVGGGGDLAVGVVGVAGLTEAESETIQLGAVHDVGDGFGRRSERDGEDAGGERVERAAMAGFLGVEGSADAVDHVRAGQSGRLVDDQPAVERTATRLAAGHGCRCPDGEGGGVWGDGGDVNGGSLGRRQSLPVSGRLGSNVRSRMASECFTTTVEPLKSW